MGRARYVPDSEDARRRDAVFTAARARGVLSNALARAAGCSPSAVTRWKHGSPLPGGDEAIRRVEALLASIPAPSPALQEAAQESPLGAAGPPGEVESALADPARTMPELCRTIRRKAFVELVRLAKLAQSERVRLEAWTKILAYSDGLPTQTTLTLAPQAPADRAALAARIVGELGKVEHIRAVESAAATPPQEEPRAGTAA